jgi:serine/threonine-protein phosphatase 5
MQVVTTLLAYKCLEPSSVYLTRGNHETVAMNRMYGFEGEVCIRMLTYADVC